jgi:hypothetical protein
VPNSRISAFAIAFVRTLTPMMSRTTGSPSKSGTSSRGVSANNATRGSARNVRLTPAQSASNAVKAWRRGDT